MRRLRICRAFLTSAVKSLQKEVSLVEFLQKNTKYLNIYLYLFIIIILCYPIFIVKIPLLTDYPNHLSRMYIEESIMRTSDLARYYYLKPGLYPYLAMNAVIEPLIRFIGLENAGRVFVMLSILAPFLGSIALAKSLHGRVGLAPMLGALFCYNSAIAWGFLTFTFTVGLALAGFAVWIATEHWRLAARLPLASLLAAAVFLGHIFVFGMYCLLLLGWEFDRLWIARRSLSAKSFGDITLKLLQFVPVGACYYFMGNVAVGDTHTDWGPITSHFMEFLSPLQFIMTSSELKYFIIPVLILFCLSILSGLSYNDKTIKIMLSFIVLSIVMPMWLFGVSFVNIRFPIMLLFLITASIRFQTSIYTKFIALFFISILIPRIFYIGVHLSDMDKDVGNFRESAKIIAAGSRVLPTFVPINRDASGNIFINDKDVSNYLHLESILVIDSAIFCPLIFQMFQVGINPNYISSATSHGLPVPFAWLNDRAPSVSELVANETIYWNNWKTDFDYVVLFDFGTDPGPIPAHLSLVGQGDFFKIYKVI